MTDKEKRIHDRAWELFTFSWAAYIQEAYDWESSEPPPPWNAASMYNQCVTNATVVESLTPTEEPTDGDS